MSKRQTAEASALQKLDALESSPEFRRTRELVDSALRKYGEPRMSLMDLRKAVDKCMGEAVLSEAIIEAREAGF